VALVKAIRHWIRSGLPASHETLTPLPTDWRRRPCRREIENLGFLKSPVGKVQHRSGHEWLLPDSCLRCLEREQGPARQGAERQCALGMQKSCTQKLRVRGTITPVRQVAFDVSLHTPVVDADPSSVTSRPAAVCRSNWASKGSARVNTASTVEPDNTVNRGSLWLIEPYAWSFAWPSDTGNLRRPVMPTPSARENESGIEGASRRTDVVRRGRSRLLVPVTCASAEVRLTRAPKGASNGNRGSTTL
jgi:hypothetical protein